MVPTGYPAYARVLHPVECHDDSLPRRWADVAAGTGRTMHPLARWWRVAGLARIHASRADGEPQTGSLEPASLRALCDVLTRHTPSGSTCWFAVWNGWGDLHPAGASTTFVRRGSTPPPPAQAPPEWQLDLAAATFELPGREYYLFTGSLDDALRVGRWYHRDWFAPRSPQLFWPDDRSWCVATEIDLDSTLVGGSEALITDVLGCPDLEAFPISPDASLQWDADSINSP